jgi:hypothetical protein
LPVALGSAGLSQVDGMNSKTRRKLEMGARVLEFSREHPDVSPAYASSVTRLEALLARADLLEAQQREGILLSRAATNRKQELRRSLKLGLLKHLAGVAEAASAEVPELLQKFTLPETTQSYRAFRAAARGIEAEVRGRKELLVKYGLSETGVTAFTAALEEFDAMVKQGSDSRIAHVGASFELDEVGDEVVQVVKVMNGLKYHLFSRDGELMASWASASNVVATPHPPEKEAGPAVEPPVSGDVRPAA